jgi:hypothetical protein
MLGLQDGGVDAQPRHILFGALVLQPALLQLEQTG